MKPFDVYAYGVISSSTLYLLKQPFPKPDDYAEIASVHAMTGGEALNSSIVLSRLGKRCLLDGNWIGDNAEGRSLIERINSYGIDCARLSIVPGYTGVTEIVFSDDKTRTIFGTYVDLLTTTRKWNSPCREDFSRAELICIDPPFGAESSLAGQYAVEAGVPFVSIDAPYDHILATHAEVIIISGEFRGQKYPGADLAALFAEYQSRARGLVIFTVGAKDILYARPGQPVQSLQPYTVEVIDSAGAGDSFRAGILYGLLNGWDDLHTIQYASAVAALVCASFPGVLNSPSHEQVLAFIDQHR